MVEIGTSPQRAPQAAEEDELAKHSVQPVRSFRITRQSAPWTRPDSVVTDSPAPAEFLAAFLGDHRRRQTLTFLKELS